MNILHVMVTIVLLFGLTLPCAQASEEHSSDVMAQTRADFAQLQQIEASLDAEEKTLQSGLEALERDFGEVHNHNAARASLLREAQVLLGKCAKQDGDPNRSDRLRADLSAQMQRLKAHEEMSAELRLEACSYVDQVSDTMGLKECKNYEKLASSAAAAARHEAKEALRIAGTISKHYGALVSEQGAASGATDEMRLWIQKFETLKPLMSMTVEVPEISSAVLLGEAQTLAARIHAALQAAALPQAAFAEAQEMLGALMERIDTQAQQIQGVQDRYEQIRAELDASGGDDAQDGALAEFKTALQTCMQSVPTAPQDDLSVEADAARILGAHADDEAKEALTCSRQVGAVCAQIVPCKRDHDCPMDKVCGDEGLCVRDRGNSGFDTAAWDTRESERTQRTEEYGGDEDEGRFSGDTIREANEENIRKFKERNANDGFDAKDEASSETFGTPSSSKQEYYLLRETADYLERTAKCTSVVYTIYGPSDDTALKAHLKALTLENKMRLNAKNFPLYTKITTVKLTQSPQEPDLPKESRRCTPCPSGQFIGIGPDERHCH